MKAQVKTTVGEVNELLEKAIDYYRLKMTHGSTRILKNRGLFSNEYQYLPMGKSDYWSVMMQVSPWKEIEGFFNMALTFPKDREMWISVELASRLGIGARG